MVGDVGGTIGHMLVLTPETVTDLARWMDSAELAGSGDLPSLAALSGGTQNQLFRVDRGGESYVLRTVGPGADEARLKGLRREHRLLRALKGSDLPHAQLVAGDDGDEVLGRPFYLMQHVDGWSPTQGWPAPYDTDLDLRGRLAFDLIDGAAKLANIDWEARGLQGFGRVEGFHDRQVDRWTTFLEGYRFRDIPGLDEASAWLRGHRPHSWKPGLSHGDYQFANVMFDRSVPAGLAAIIDWEMATIGDPLLDLAWALIAWSPEGDDMPHMRFLDLDGMPPREVLLEQYERVSGRSTEDIDYYVVLARWKLAIVLEKSYARYVAGGPADADVATWGPLILELMRKAAELSRTAKARKVI
jgi:aminoglycoside phosphotransferase (APT) family kinase protein